MSDQEDDFQPLQLDVHGNERNMMEIGKEQKLKVIAIEAKSILFTLNKSRYQSVA